MCVIPYNEVNTSSLPNHTMINNSLHDITHLLYTQTSYHVSTRRKKKLQAKPDKELTNLLLCTHSKYTNMIATYAK